ncbi:MAG: glycosyltransferase family 8 protein [Methylacidiphilales bacterium]|nr:glycosyltransferase family 8 protein [Candidatus Methylacidiphilales bacterium]NJR14876.1 glycosyltransferase family 8 protein [Calothrix sp. CSU_2_0]
MEILFCFDERYEQHFGVSVTSLLINNFGEVSKIHIIIDKLSDNLKQKLDEISQNYKVEVCIYKINIEEFYGLKVTAHASAANYFRLLAADVLPNTLNKILYLDSDLVVNSSVDELFNLDITNYPVAACGGKAITTKQRLQLQGNYYFNSGVMLINLDYWRREEIGLKAIEFIRNYPEMIKYWDQDALNKIIDGNYINLDSRWNSLVDAYSNQSQVNQESVIIHFVGSLKPWQVWCMDTQKELYWTYLKKSMWASSTPTFPKNSKQILSAIRYLTLFVIRSFNSSFRKLKHS